MVDKQRRRYLELCAAGTFAALAGCSSLNDVGLGRDNDDAKKVDDWQYDPDESSGYGVGGNGNGNGSGGVDTAMAESDGSIGLSAGGAADVGTFRRNVYEGYLPIPQSMTYEGLFHEYYFDTGGDGSCESWFCPTYTPAITDDPLSGETERYLTVGLDSGLSQSEFERPPLNLTLVLDISGSMRSSFDDYYYDKFGNRQAVDGETNQPKIDVAKDVLAELTTHLRPEDRLGVVLFSSESSVAKPMRRVDETDMEAIRTHIQADIQAGGGTNISAGMDDAESILDEVVGGDSTTFSADEDYENRMILMTDAQTNMGETDADELRETLEARAAKDIHTTVVGIGVDFNADLIEQITAVKGSNYYSVYSTDQFEQRMIDEFEYMVTPLVYELSLELDAERYEIAQVYGSTAADEATGELLYVNTLFPSPSEGGKAKGGVVLVQVDRLDTEGAEMELTASWERRDGREQSTTETIEFPSTETGGDAYWGNDAVRKAVLLARFGTLLRTWTVHEREQLDIDENDTIESPDVDLSKWEQTSEQLTVSQTNAERIAAFREYFEREMAALGDDALDQELELMDAILAARSA
jgi:Ca-activated chloride channel family protein